MHTAVRTTIAGASDHSQPARRIGADGSCSDHPSPRRDSKPAGPFKFEVRSCVASRGAQLHGIRYDRRALRAHCHFLGSLMQQPERRLRLGPSAWGKRRPDMARRRGARSAAGPRPAPGPRGRGTPAQKSPFPAWVMRSPSFSPEPGPHAGNPATRRDSRELQENVLSQL